MKINFFYFGFLVLICFPTSSWGQMDTVLQVSEIEVTATRVRTQVVGGTTTTWKIEDLNSIPANNVGELLQNDGGIYIKSYGMGSLATSSIRGGSGSQTLVLWNGLPIQSPMLGLLDLSLLPLGGTEEISLQKGGNSSMWGSGAIGGIISLDSKNNFTNRYSLGIKSEAGSFGYFNHQFQLGIGNRKFQSITKFFHQTAENDFIYSPHPAVPDRQQTNADYQREHFLQDFYWKISPQILLGIHFWKQWSEQKIPPTIVQNSSSAIQNDPSTRLVFEVKNTFKEGHLQAKFGYFDESNIYMDGITYNNKFTNYFGELEFQMNFNWKHKILIGTSYSNTEAESAGYPENPVEDRSALFASYIFQQRKWKIKTGLRKALVDEISVPLIPSLGIDYQLFSFLKIQAKAGKNFRLPTLNDRFWAPGGNIDLLPESGWFQELGFQSKINKGNFLNKIQITGFNRIIDNWIMWANVDGSFYWSAVNVEKVWSRGLELNTSFSYQKNNLQIQWDVGGAYVLSTTEFDLARPKMNKGEQLFYTPKIQATTKLKLSWKNFHATYDHSFTSYARGLNEGIDKYLVGNASLLYSFKNKISSNNLFFRINNIWDTDYFVVERRPMPGIHYQAGVNFNF